MSTSILITNATLVDWLPEPSVERADLLIRRGAIAGRGHATSGATADQVVNADGAFVMPGWVIAHHHLYSALARGMPQPPHAPANFAEVLEWVWWVVDRCLDEQSNRMSGLVGGLDALTAGATCIIDHHASPNAISGSLSLLGEALRSIGVRSVLAYEVSDRDGDGCRVAGIDENFAYRGIEGWSWPFPGGHASFTMSDEALAAFSSGDRDGRIHVHLLEDPCDRALSEARYGAGPIERFDQHGLIGPNSLFAHGVHLTDEELALLVERGAWLVCNQRSNANNNVGIRRLDDYAGIACLGTDGMDGDLWSELKFAYFEACNQGSPNAMGAVLSCLQNNYKLASQLTGLTMGSLQPGSPADLMLVDYPAPTPVTGSNVLGHVVYGMGRQHVRDVMTNGVWRIRDRVLPIETDPVYQDAHEAAVGLWSKMKALWTSEGGHPFKAAST